MATIVGLYFKSPIETGGTNALTGLRTGTLIEPAAWVASHAYAVGDIVSSSGTAYSCNTAHTSGASLAADSSKWNSLGSCAQAPTTTIGTVYTLYFRTIDNTTGSDPGQDSTTNIIFTPPANTEVSANGSTGWTGSALQLSVPATGGNYPIYVKQTSAAITSPGGLSIGALDWTTGARPPQVGTVTVGTVGVQSIPLSWTDVDMSTGGHYEILRTTANDLTTNPVPLTTSLADGSGSYTNNVANGNPPVNNNAYWYHVRGVDNRGVGAWATAVSAVTYFWSDDFADNSLDAALWHTYTAGGGTVSETGGRLVANTTSNADKAFFETQRPIKTDRDGKVVINGLAKANAAAISMATIWRVAGLTDNTVAWDNTAITFNVLVGTNWSCSYWTGAGTRYYLQSDGSWSTSNYTFTNAFTADEAFTYQLDIDKTNDRWRIILSDSGGVLKTSAYATLSTLRGGTGDLYAGTGDLLDSAIYDLTWSDFAYTALA